MLTQVITQHEPISIGFSEDFGEDQLPPVISVGGYSVHAPMLTGDGMFLVDTGEAILELSESEIDVLRVAILSLDMTLAA